jgi:hypothetical protein
MAWRRMCVEDRVPFKSAAPPWPGILVATTKAGDSLMKRQLGPLFWVEALLAAGNAILLVMTLVWKDWVEIVFDVNPDAGSGAVEWAIVGITLVLSIVLLLLALAELRRSSTQLT